MIRKPSLPTLNPSTPQRPLEKHPKYVFFHNGDGPHAVAFSPWPGYEEFIEPLQTVDIEAVKVVTLMKPNEFVYGIEFPTVGLVWFRRFAAARLARI